MTLPRRLTAVVVGMVLTAGAHPVLAEDVDPKALEFFEAKIRPVLVQQCYSCHSAGAKSIKGGLWLDTRDGLRNGGESGAAVVPGNVEESLLIEALRHESFEMPPKGKLPDNVIADFVRWVKMGAPDPRDGKVVEPSKIDVEAGRSFWAFQSPRRPQEPVIEQRSWPRGSIDRFILARLEQAELAPVDDADRRTLIRRLSYDLTGLPPTPAEVEAFVDDTSTKAVETLVDRLLASPRFGERWGRHWLDVARYGESTGKERNVPYPYAWRYRDYVIDAINSDRPYDQFIREQVAGDLLPADSVDERNELNVATGFLALGTKGLNERNAELYAMDVADEQIDVVSRAVLGITVSCARCHDHKFDPIPTSDYYAIAGIFRSTEVLAGVSRGNNKKGYAGEYCQLEGMAPEVASAPSKKDLKEIALLETQLAQRQKAANQLAKQEKAGNAAAKAKRAKAAKKLKGEIDRLEGEIADLQKSAAPSAAAPAMAVTDAAKPQNCRINIRGEVTDLGPEVPRGFLSVLPKDESLTLPADGSGRRELAEWLTSPENPLTARVMANRVWAHLFGSGLVETVDNFGALGDRPSHPELLDYLAVRFMEEGWSVKRLIREIVLSRTYQLSSAHDARNYEADPQNRLMWRMTRRRLEAEAIRDAMLAIGGQLDPARPHGSPVMTLASGEIGRNLDASFANADYTFRSVYLPVVRAAVPDVLTTFDVADPSLVVGQRDVTTVATQALFMLNSPFVFEQSERMARRLLEQKDMSDDTRIDAAYQLALSRPATPEEEARALRFLQGAGEEAEGWTAFCQALLASAEFRYVY